MFIKMKIGTRGSRLALRQAQIVRELFVQAGVRTEIELVVLHTKGDKVLDKPLSEIGDKGIFVSEFEQALLEGRIDLAVHSAKDLPVALAEGLTIAAVPKRGDVRDVLVMPRDKRCPQIRSRTDRMGTQEIPSFVVGSGSRRRQQQAVQLWDNIVCKDIRGNVDSRLRKLQEGLYDGILLAKAGLDRLGITPQQERQFLFSPLPPEEFLPAACQGIIAVEASQTSPLSELCEKITDRDTKLCFLVEREVLGSLSADCREPVAAWCRRVQSSLVLDVMYADSKRSSTCAPELGEALQMARETARLVKTEYCTHKKGREEV